MSLRIRIIAKSAKTIIAESIRTKVERTLPITSTITYFVRTRSAYVGIIIITAAASTIIAITVIATIRAISTRITIQITTITVATTAIYSIVIEHS